MKKRLVLIDGHALLFRAFYAFPPTLTTGKGEVVNAVYGFSSMLLNVIRELEPTHIAVSFDLKELTFRHKSYKEYKANREETPQDLIAQEGRVRQVVESLNIPVYEMAGFEADDVIGTLALQAVTGKDEGKVEVVIVTGDMDALQLVDDDVSGGEVKVYVPARGKRPAKMYDETQVEERYGGLEPEQLVDYKALAGDPSDNIPGVKGVGPKTAIALLTKYKTVEDIYEVMKAGKLKSEFSESVIRKLKDDEEMAFKSKELARIVRKVPLKFQLKECVVHEYDKKKVLQLFEELEFESLARKLPNDGFEQEVQEALF